MTDAIEKLGCALKRSGAKVTLDPGRNITYPCTFCGRAPHAGVYRLRDIGRYPNGDTLTRPVCEECSPLAEPYERGLSQVKLLEGLPLPPPVLADLAELERCRRFAPRCRQCGNGVEPERYVYATPVCFSCLPPPEPLPEASLRSDARKVSA